MNSFVPNHRSVFYTVEEVAGILGVPEWRVRRAVRTGALHTVWRRSRRLVPAYALARLLTEPEGAPPPTPDTSGGGDSR